MKIFKHIMLIFLTGMVGIPKTQGQGILYEVIHPDRKTRSFVFGTFHIGVKPPFDYMERIKSYMAGCQYYVGEINTDSLHEQQVNALTVAPFPKSLRGMLSESEYQKVRSYLQDNMNTGIAPFEGKYPGFLNMALSQYTAVKMMEDPTYSMDREFQKFAKNIGKKTMGLETDIEAIQKMLIEVPSEVQKKMLMSTIEDQQSDFSKLKKTIQLYNEGNIDSIYMEAFLELPLEFMNIMIKERNKKWIDRLTGILLKGNAFIAVGALHLPGRDGIIESLRQRGFGVNIVTF